MRSFLNIIDLVNGRQIRAAEFGFCAERPSFRGDNEIIFYRGDKQLCLSLKTGAVSLCTDNTVRQFPNGEPRIYLNFTSDPTEETSYVELIYENSHEQRIIARFMGSDGTLGTNPFNSDKTKVVFFGYPSENTL